MKTPKNQVFDHVDIGTWWYITRGEIHLRRYPWADAHQPAEQIEDPTYRGMVVRVLDVAAWPHVLCACVWDSGTPIEKIPAGNATPPSVHDVLRGASTKATKVARRVVVPFKNVEARRVPPEWVATALGCKPEELPS